MNQKSALMQHRNGVIFSQGKAQVSLWAPYADRVFLAIENHPTKLSLNNNGDGTWALETDQLFPGNLYHFELVKGSESLKRADPASLLQANGVHGPSTAVDLTAFQFTDEKWELPALAEFIIYELHVGTFTELGTFDAVAEKLDHLISLGITAVEILPVAAFPGDRNWGYDGVFPFAVHQAYGGPEKLQQLVDTCHSKGLAVILDVVYNHFGPEGNHFTDFAPYFTDKHHTPWGDAINFDDSSSNYVRQFFIENALMWLRDFHIDALRLDAVHAIKDESDVHFLAELADQVAILENDTKRKHYLIAETDLNEAKYITPTPEGYGMHAQWNDDFHHALRVAAGQKREGYYADFNGLEDLAKAYCNGYVYDGMFSEQRQKVYGTGTEGRAGEQFVVYSQNHDQIGNRMLGERSSILYGFEMQKLLAGAVLIAPFLPMFFMGEEWGETNPFLYFVNHSDKDLIEAVREGRKNEFKSFHLDGDMPDPQAEETFMQAKVQWQLLEDKKHQEIFDYYKSFIALRKENKVLSILDRKKIKVDTLPSQNCLMLHRWHDNEKLLCLLNFSKDEQSIVFPDQVKWTKIIDSASPRFGGEKESAVSPFNGEILMLQPESIVLFTRKDA